MPAAPPLLRRVAALVLSSICLASARAAVASTLPPGFQETPVITDRTEPTAVRFAPNGKVFVAEKSGLLWVYSGVSDRGPKIVIDLRAAVHDFWDRGLLGLAVDPQYPARPYVYVLYTHDTWPPGDQRFGDPTQPRWGTGLPNPSTSDPCPNPPGATDQGCVVYGRLSRITVDQTTLVGTEQVMLDGNWCQQYPSHSIGDLLFGDDGYLYVSAGDGAAFTGPDIGETGNPCGDPMNGGGVNAEGGSLRSQDILTQGDPTSFDGSILRLDVSSLPVTAPATNPLVGNGVADDDFTIAVGLRNPFRMTKRPGTGEIWVGDVGDGTWEEINRIPSPATPVEDFGWPCYEGGNGVNSIHVGHDQQILCKRIYGTASPPVPANIAVTPSYWAYNHGAQIVAGESCPTGSSSTTGLVFKTGSAFPAHYQKALFFEDSSRSCMWVMIAGANGLPNPTQIETFLSNGPGEMVDLQQGPDGALYYVSFSQGNVYRVSYFSTNTPPTAAISATPTNGIAPLAVQFSAAGSSDPEDGTNLTYSWDLDGDGVFGDATGVTTSRTYAHSGVVTAAVRATDSQGASATASVVITAGNTPPVPTITSPSSSLQWSVGQTINFSGSATDPQDGVLPASRLTWNVILHHCHAVGDCHTHAVTTLAGAASGSIDGPEHEYPSYLELQLTATDLPPADWFDWSWSRRRKIAFNNLAQAEDLQNFPVLVELDPTRIDYAQTLPGGRDLRFADAAGNPLAYEIESWNAGGVSTVWVRAPLIHAGSNADSIWMYYGNPAAATSGENAPAVWSNGYAGVWHLGDLLDSTANNNDGVDFGTASAAGAFGLGRSFNGASWVDLGAGASLAITGSLTTEGWISIANPNQTGSPRVLDKKQTSSSTFGYDLEYAPSANNVTANGSGTDFARADSVDLDTNWHYLAVGISGVAGSVYVDGINRTTDSTVTALTASSQHLELGSRAGVGDFFSGSIDEVRVSNVLRSQAWIAAQYLSMTDAFATYGTEQTQGTLSASTSLNLDPLAVQIQFKSVPSGLQLTQNTETARTPFTRTFIVNAHPVVNAPSPQAYVGMTQGFQGWSDAGAQTHTVVAPSTNATLIATYQPVATCADGIDNDGDGRIDFDGGASANHGVPLGPPDPGCKDGSVYSIENPACNDGIDNDGDGKVDYPADPQCQAPWGGSESACGLGFEIAPVLAGLVAWRRRIARAIRATRSG